MQDFRSASWCWSAKMSAGPETAALLGKTALFGGLCPDDLARIASEMNTRIFEQHQLIFARGDLGHEIYLVAEGRVRLSVDSIDGRAIAFGHAAEGSIFGEIATLDGGLRSADATALTRARVFTLSQSALKREIAANPRVAQAAIVFLCERVRATSEQLEQVAIYSTEIRLARFLLHDVEVRLRYNSSASLAVDLGMSQTEIALLLGMTRQSVNGAFGTLEHLGALKRVGSQSICEVERLRQIAAFE
jgi:CRP/FNR family transcriptional regulator, cyclic AMP receptor protein